jgi:hypothetical protein
MFDTVYCEYPLPEAAHQGLEFQTKDLERFLGTYTITRDGRLVRHARRGGRGEPDRDVEWPLHGDIRFYTSEDKEWIEYVARFTHGQVEWIRPLEEVRPDPGLPDRDPDWEPLPWPFPVLPKDAVLETEPYTPPGAITGDEAGRDDAEEALLQSLRRDRSELEKLLEGSSNHWGYEDPVYRFYHQSFKVYGLQHQTRTIRDRLQALAPGLPLNPWFVQIFELGTGKRFEPEGNARWPEVTRPILEAFFHARFFLEMAVRYADLQAPPRPLPSGYAALLYLFGLR